MNKSTSEFFSTAILLTLMKECAKGHFGTAACAKISLNIINQERFFLQRLHIEPRVAFYEDNHFPPPLPSRRSGSTKRADTSRACTCNILVSTISRSALCRFHRLRMRKRKSIYIRRSYNDESGVKT